MNEDTFSGHLVTVVPGIMPERKIFYAYDPFFKIAILLKKRRQYLTSKSKKNKNTNTLESYSLYRTK